MGLYSGEAIKAAVNRQVQNSDMLIDELLSQAGMVQSIVLDMRQKIIDGILTDDNVVGCVFGHVDDYLPTFDEQTEHLKQAFAENREKLLK